MFVRKIVFSVLLMFIAFSAHAYYDDYTVLNSHSCYPSGSNYELRFQVSRFMPNVPHDYVRVVVMNSQNTLIDDSFEISNYTYAYEYLTGAVIPYGYSYRITSFRSDIDTGWIACN